MKRILLGLSQGKLLATLELILKNWGYRVIATSRPQQMLAFLRETSPEMILVDADMLAGEDLPLHRALAAKVAAEGIPAIVLADRDRPCPSLEVPHDTLSLPLDIFALFELVQKYVETFARKNLRLEVKLPVLVCPEEKNSYFGEVLSLSTGGMFIKTGYRLEEDAELKIIIPLVGMKREMEIDGRVIYRVDPCLENNYIQGVGISFSSLGEEDSQALADFIENAFFKKLEASEESAANLATDQFRWRAREITIRLKNSR